MQKNDAQKCLPVVPGLFTLPTGEAAAVLLGGHCLECTKDFFPCPPRCPHCLGEVQEKSLGSTGKLYTYTVVRVKPPWGLPRPYGLGYVDLDDCGLRVLGLLAPEVLEDLTIGLPLRLAVGELGCDFRGNPCLRPFFERADEKKSKRCKQ